MKRGSRPTLICASTRWLRGSTRATELPSVDVTQTDPAPTAGTKEPGAVFTRAAIALRAGSICSSVPASSATIHTPPSPAAMPPSLSATGVGTCATTLLVAASTRPMRASPQLGTHTEPKPTARPEQGASLTGTVATILLLAGSIREMLFFVALEIQTASGAIPTQSGLPGIDSFAVTGN